MTKLDIHGTIKRKCEMCHKFKDCNCFSLDGKSYLMCEDCTSKKFGTIKPKKKDIPIEDIKEFCNVCSGMTMTLREGSVKQKKDSTVYEFECQKCNKRKKVTLRGQR